MEEFAVYLTSDVTTVTDDQLDDLMDALAPFHVSLSLAEGRLTAQLTVEAAGLVHAAEIGAQAVQDALDADPLLAGSRLVAVQVMTGEEFDQWLSGNLATAEVARLLGVSRQRVLQLEKDDPAMPRSVMIGRAKMWPAAAIRRYASRPRTVGRPAAAS
jgi:predicted DNA-binding transcriptional regulator AlpA